MIGSNGWLPHSTIQLSVARRVCIARTSDRGWRASCSKSIKTNMIGCTTSRRSISSIPIRPLIGVRCLSTVAGSIRRSSPTKIKSLSFRLASHGVRLVFAPDAIVYHQHVTSLLKYLRRKFSIGYWKALVLKRHPDKAVRDTHTPQVIKVQMGLLAAAIIVTIAASLTPMIVSVALSLWLLLLLSMLPLLIKIARRDPPIVLIAPLMIVLRALGLGTGLAIGLIRFSFLK